MFIVVELWEMNLYLEAFSIFFKIGAFTIGGGYAMVPLIENEIVTRRQWLTKEDFIDLLAIAQSSPGILAVNISIFIGYRLKGILHTNYSNRPHEKCVYRRSLRSTTHRCHYFRWPSRSTSRRSMTLPLQARHQLRAWRPCGVSICLLTVWKTCLHFCPSTKKSHGWNDLHGNGSRIHKAVCQTQADGARHETDPSNNRISWCIRRSLLQNHYGIYMLSSCVIYWLCLYCHTAAEMCRMSRNKGNSYHNMHGRQAHYAIGWQS